MITSFLSEIYYILLATPVTTLVYHFKYPSFTVQTEQVDFQSELYSYKIYRKTT